MSDERPPIEQLLDRVLFAPLGLLAAWRDELPKLAAHGRREVATARMFGQFAVQQGRRELDRRFGAGRAPTPTTSDVPTEPTVVADPVAAAVAAMDASTLPIADYDSLAASQVVARLAALAPGELDAVEAYEAAGRGRRTILGKIHQLRGSA